MAQYESFTGTVIKQNHIFLSFKVLHLYLCTFTGEFFLQVYLIEYDSTVSVTVSNHPLVDQ